MRNFQMCSLRHSWSLVLGFSLLVGSGCSETAKNEPVDSSQNHGHDHEEHDHGPESLKDALAEVKSLRNTIRDSFAKNDQDAAHGPLHEVGEVLEAIPELAKKEKVSLENQAAIETAVNTLMDAFGNVDKTMHGQEGSTYSEESATIDAAMETLSQACGKESTAVEPQSTNPVPTQSGTTDPPVDATTSPAAESESEVTPESRGE